MENRNFPIEFRSEVEETVAAEVDLYDELEIRLHALEKGHKDITGAAVHITKPAHERHTSFVYEASVVVYMRPSNIAAVEKDKNPMSALKNALTAVERQVRAEREKLRGG